VPSSARFQLVPKGVAAAVRPGTQLTPTGIHAGYLLGFLRVRRPVANGITKRVYGHTSQEVRPFPISSRSR